jgi:hypothetical protein
MRIEINSFNARNLNNKMISIDQDNQQLTNLMSRTKLTKKDKRPHLVSSIDNLAEIKRQVCLQDDTAHISATEPCTFSECSTLILTGKIQFFSARGKKKQF